MATSAGEVEVKLSLNSDDFKKGIADSQKNLGDFNGALQTIGTALVAAFSFAKIAEFFQNSLEAYGHQQLAIAQMVATLGAHGIASQELVTHLAEQSRALEALSGIEQVSITRAQTMLATYGLQGVVLDQATKAAVDFTVRTGSLEVSTNLLAKAFEGNTTMLKRYGIVVDQTVSPAQQFASLLEQISARFGPVAAAQAGTFTGEMNAMKNAFTHLEEAVGKLMAGQAGEFMTWLKSAIEWATNMVPKLASIGTAIDAMQQTFYLIGVSIRQNLVMAIVSVSELLVEIGSHLPVIGHAFEQAQAELASFKAQLVTTHAEELKRFADNQGLAARQAKMEADMASSFSNQAQTKMDVSAVMNAWISKQNDLSKNEFLANLKEEDQGYGAFVDSFVTTQTQMWGFATQMSNTFFTGFGDNFAKMMVEGKNFSDSMKTLFRDMAEQMISYIVQIIAKLIVMFALEQATGFGGGGSAVSVFDGAFASGGVITEPSVILGLQTGSRTLAGEAGPEMVSPMSGGSQGGSADAGSGGKGGNITINISGQLIEGDASSWRQLVNSQIIPAIRRYSMANPSGPFNRTRGAV